MGVLERLTPSIERGVPTIPVEALADRRARLVAEATFQASQTRITGMERNPTKTAEWQARAFAAYRERGEIWYAAQFYARVLSGLKLYAARRMPDGSLERIETGDPAAAVDRLRDRRGTFASILAPAGRLLFLAGEGYLFGWVPHPPEAPKDGGPPPPADTEERWEFISASEIKVTKTEIIRTSRKGQQVDDRSKFREPENGQQLGPGNGLVYRIWRPDPEWSGEADSPMQATVELCDELGLMTRGIRARLRSRLAAAGILFLPEEALPPIPPPPPGTPDGAPVSDPFVDSFYRAATASIADEGVASSVAPIAIRMKGEGIDKVRLEQWGGSDPGRRKADSDERIETVKRIAIGLDLPPEILLGVTDANHWTAWQIDEDAWKAHVKPIADLIVGELTSAYLIPTLGNPAGETNIVIAYDESEVVSRPDRGASALEAHDRLALKDESLRQELGFGESDAIDLAEAEGLAEYRRRLGVKMGDVGLALGEEPSGTAGEPPPTPDAQPDGDDPGEVDPGPPVEGEGIAAARILPDAVATPEWAAIDTTLALACERARELAGSRLRSRVSRNGHTVPEGLVRDAQRVPNEHVAAVLGREAVRGLGLDADTLVRGGEGIYRARLEALGVEDCDRHIEHALAHAAEHLYVRGPIPAPYRP